jgi:hypothetical protein
LACQPSMNLKVLISPELLTALKAWNDLGVKIFDGRDPHPVEEWVGRAYVELASFLAAKVQNELGVEWEVLYQDMPNSWTWVQRSV